MQTLEDLDLDENTYVIFLSDHGYMWGEHGLGGKWLLYEESIRIPIMIIGPGISGKLRGMEPENIALNIDIAPTILDMAGIPVPSEMDGKSLYPQLRGIHTPERTDFFMEHVDIIKVENPIPDSRGVRTEDWKYIRYINVEPEVEEMYHIKKDPLESQNLANDENYREIKDHLKERYQEYLSSFKK